MISQAQSIVKYNNKELIITEGYYFWNNNNKCSNQRQPILNSYLKKVISCIDVFKKLIESDFKFTRITFE